MPRSGVARARFDQGRVNDAPDLLPSRHRRRSPPPRSHLRVPSPNRNRPAIGALLGGAAGAYARSQIGDGRGQMAATAVGTLLGVSVGSEIGRRLDEVERTCAGQVFEQAPDNRTIEWQNPNEGTQYPVTPSRTFSDSDAASAANTRPR